MAQSVALVVLVSSVAFAEEPPPSRLSDAADDAPASTPATAASISTSTATEKKDPPLALSGFDLSVSLFDTSGVYGGSEGYLNQLSIWIDPTFKLGKRFAEGTFWEPLAISAHLPLDVEVAGSDPRFRGRAFGSGSLFDAAPETLPINSAQESITAPSGQVSGLSHRALVVGDSWLTLGHSKLLTIPTVGTELGSSIRAVVPTSIGSRNAGLITSLSGGVSLTQALGPVTLSYAFRATKYFYTRSSPAIAPLEGGITVNGQAVTPWTPASTGVTNPNWGLVNSVTAEVELPKNFSVSVGYSLFNTKGLGTSGCSVDGVPTANLCTDGALVGDVRPGATRDEQWFNASVDWKPSFWSVGLGLGTFRPLRTPNGQIAQPFFIASRDNYTTVFLSFSASAEALVQSLSKEAQP